MTSWLAKLLRGNKDVNPEFERFLDANSQTLKTFAKPTSDADCRTKMDSLFDNLKQAAKIPKETRDSPSEQNLSAYVKLMEQIISSHAVFQEEKNFQNISKLKEEMADFFLESISVDSESVDYFSMIADIYCQVGETFLSPSNEMAKLIHNAIARTGMFLFNSADFSAKFAERVVRSDKLMKTLLSLINRFAEDHVKGSLSNSNLELLIYGCALVYNVIRLSDADNVMRVRHFGFLEAMRPFLKCSRFRVILKNFVILIINFGASEEEAKECADESAVKFLVDAVTDALKSRNKMYQGFSSMELLEAVKKHAVVDEHKKLLAKSGCLKLMKSRLEKGDDKELPHVFSITTLLAFDEENAVWMGRELLSLLDSKFLNSENQNLRDRAMKLKWIVEEKTGKSHTAEASSAAKVPSEQQHIMISYQHDSQPIVRKLVDRLQKEKLKVWVDFNDMKGNVTDAMTFAVENASVVLVCMSLKYKDSEFCKMEAEFALKQKKRIVPLKMDTWKADGWLGLLTGQKMFYDFSESADFETKIGELLKSLHGDGSEPAEEQEGSRL